MPQIFNLRWRGMLTTGNIVAVARLFKLLLNRKRFAYANVRPLVVSKIDDKPLMIDTRVEVHTRQKLEDKGIRASASDGTAMLSVPTTEYLCMYQTSLRGDRAPHDYTHKNPYISFEGDRVTIKWQTPCGDQAVDVFVLEVR